MNVAKGILLVIYRGRFLGLKAYVAGATFVTGILVARGLGEIAFTEYALLVVYSNLLAIGCGMSVSAYCVYVQVAESSQEVPTILGNIAVTYLSASLLAVGAWFFAGLPAEFLIYLCISLALVAIFGMEGIFRAHERAFLGFAFDQALRPTLILLAIGGALMGVWAAPVPVLYGSAIVLAASVSLAMGWRFLTATSPKIHLSADAWATQLRFASAQITMLFALNLPFIIADLLYNGAHVAVMRGAQMLLNVAALINMSVIQPKLALVRSLIKENKILELNVEICNQVRLLLPLNFIIAALTIILAGPFNRQILQIEHDFWIIFLYVLIYSIDLIVFPLDQIYAQIGRSLYLAGFVISAAFASLALILLLKPQVYVALIILMLIIVASRFILAMQLAKSHNIYVGLSCIISQKSKRTS